jgi:hypothetical protein
VPQRDAAWDGVTLTADPPLVFISDWFALRRGQLCGYASVPLPCGLKIKGWRSWAVPDATPALAENGAMPSRKRPYAGRCR